MTPETTSRGHRPPHWRPPPKRPREHPCTPCPRSPGSGPAPAGAPGSSRGQRPRNGSQEHYAGELAAGQVPSIRQIKREWPVGYDRATELHDHLTAVIETAS